VRRSDAPMQALGHAGGAAGAAAAAHIEALSDFSFFPRATPCRLRGEELGSVRFIWSSTKKLRTGGRALSPGSRPSYMNRKSFG
jgi:hypothetical protein